MYDLQRSDDPLSATLTQLNVNDLKPSSARKQSALNKRSVMSATSHRDVARAPVGLMSQMSPVISSRKIPLPPIIRQDSAAVRRQREGWFCDTESSLR